MTAPTRVKVRVVDLIAAVEERRARMLADHIEAVRAAEAEQSNWRAAVEHTLLAAATAAAKGKLPDTGGYVGERILRVPIKVEPFHAPGKRPDTTEIDRLLKTLKMAAEETISVSAVDAARYLG